MCLAPREPPSGQPDLKRQADAFDVDSLAAALPVAGSSADHSPVASPSAAAREYKRGVAVALGLQGLRVPETDEDAKKRKKREQKKAQKQRLREKKKKAATEAATSKGTPGSGDGAGEGGGIPGDAASGDGASGDDDGEEC